MTRRKAARTKQEKVQLREAGELLPPQSNPVIAEATELVSRAALLLRSLGADYEKVAWALEDTIMYLGPSEVFFDFESEFDDVPGLHLDPRGGPLRQGKTKAPESGSNQRKVS